MSNAAGKWFERTTIRNNERIIISDYADQDGLYHYPRGKLPITFHPKVIKRGSEALQFLLTQACYQFLEEIAGIEENIVIDISAKLLAQGELSRSDSQGLRTVCIEEYYHSFLGWDYYEQLIDITGIKPLSFSGSSTIDTMHRISNTITNAKVRDFFEINVLCLVENTISSSLLEYAIDEACHEAFVDMNKLHLKDEGRHGKFFQKFLLTSYQATSLDIQEQVALLLPKFIKQSLDAYQEKRDYAKLVLTHLEFSEEDILTIIEDTFPDTKAKISFSTLNVGAGKNMALLEQFDIFKKDNIIVAFQQENLEFS